MNEPLMLGLILGSLLVIPYTWLVHFMLDPFAGMVSIWYVYTATDKEFLQDNGSPK
jgi:hypothetical protein